MSPEESKETPPVEETEAADPAAAGQTPAEEVREHDLSPLKGEAAGGQASNIDLLMDVSVPVVAQLGATEVRIKDILQLLPGSIVELDKLAGDPVDVLVNERLVARGEVLVLNDVFCVRISEVLSNDPHRVTV